MYLPYYNKIIECIKCMVLRMLLFPIIIIFASPNDVDDF